MKRQDVHTLETVRPILAKLLDESAAIKVSSLITSPKTKQALIDNTDEALASGAFGLPWFRATNSRGPGGILLGLRPPKDRSAII